MPPVVYRMEMIPQDVLNLIQPLAEQYGPEAGKGAAAAMGGLLVKGVVKAGKSAMPRDTEQFAGLYGALAAAVISAAVKSAADENGDTEALAFWEPGAQEDWWDQFAGLLLEPLSDSGAWRIYVAHLIEDSDDTLKSVRDRLDRVLTDLRQRGAEVPIDTDGFLYWLGPCLLEEIRRQAAEKAESFGALVTALTPAFGYQSRGISPASVRRESRHYLEQVIRFCDARIYGPLLEGAHNPGALAQAVEVRVAVRIDVSMGAEVYEPLASRAVNGEARVISWDELASHESDVAVLGDAGLGKSWLVHSEARRLALAALEKLDSGVRPEELRFPVLARCDDLHDVDRMDGTLSFPAACLSLQRFRSEAFRDWLLRHLETAENIFLLDALDEVPYDIGSLPLGHLLQSWRDNAGRGRVILTSRLAGYRRPSGLAGVQEVEILPFSAAEVYAYVEAWGLRPAAMGKLKARLRKKEFMGLARTPLLLAFACAIADEGQSLPQTRAGLYDRVIALLLDDTHRKPERRASSGHLALSSVQQRELRRVLGHVALHFAEWADGWTDRMPERELLKAAEEAEPHDLPGPVEMAVKAGIIAPTGTKRLGAAPAYYFLHRTVAEYLVAQALASDEDRWRKALQDHLWFDPDWDQVLPMVGECMASSQPYIEALLSIEPDPLHRSLEIATRATSGTARPQQLTEICERWLALWHRGYYSVAEYLQPIAAGLSERAAAKLLESVTHGPHQDRADAVRVLAGYRDEGGSSPLLELLENSHDRHGIAEYIIAPFSMEDDGGEDFTAALLTLLNNPENEDNVREIAARALTGRDGENVTMALLAALKRPDSPDIVRRSAAVALAHHDAEEVGAALLDILEDLSTPDDLQYEVVRALGDTHGGSVRAVVTEEHREAFTAALLAIAENPDASEDLRHAAVVALEHPREEKVTAALLAILENPNTPHDVRHATVPALTSHSRESHTAALLALLEDPNTPHDVRHASVLALNGHSGENVTTALLSIIDDPLYTDDLRGAAARTLAGRTGENVTAALLHILAQRDTSDDLRYNAVFALKDRTGEAVTATLLAILSNLRNREDLLEAAVFALEGRGGDGVTTALLRILECSHISDELRQDALTVLSGRDGENITAALLAILNHPNSSDYLRRSAVSALDGRDGENITATLLAILKNPSTADYLRRSAVSALDGRDGENITAALLAILKNPDTSDSLGRYTVSVMQDRPGEDVTVAFLDLLKSPDTHGQVRYLAHDALATREPAEILSALSSMTAVAEDKERPAISSWTISTLRPVAWASHNWPAEPRAELLGVLQRLTELGEESWQDE